MDRHVFKPGDMAVITSCQIDPRVVGMYCLVDSHPYPQPVRSPKGVIRNISCVNVTIGHPTIKHANVLCLQYVPPEEWPESVFKERELNTPVGELV